MAGISGDLADMIQVVDHLGGCNPFLGVDLPRTQPGTIIQASKPRRSRLAGYQCPKLFVAELTVMIDQCPAIVMAGPNRPVK